GQTVGTALYVLDDLPERLRQPAPAWRPAPVRQAGELRHFRCRRRVRLESIATAERVTDATGPTRSASEGCLDSIELVRRVGESCPHEAEGRGEEIALIVHGGFYRGDSLAEPWRAGIAGGNWATTHDDRQSGGRRTLAFDILNGGGGTLTACFLA